MEIKQLRFDNYDSIISLWDKAGLSYRPKGRDSREGMKKEFENAPELILGAYEGEKLIGVIIGSDDGRKGWIHRLAVLPDYGRKGVASQLIEAVESVLRKRGRRIICTLIEDWNEGSLDLFKKTGYVKHEDIFYLSKREDKDV
jgi:ribosomal protein S18 acetylase RimI-like enzyme